MKKAIITLAIGEAFGEMGKITHPLMKRYADKCNADFIVLDEIKLQDQLKLLTYEKFQVHDYLNNQYDQIVFIDTDIVVLPNSPDLFDMVPSDTFAASNEELYSMSGPHKEITQKVLGNINWTAPYFNSGVMVIGKIHAGSFNPVNPLIKAWTSHSGNDDHVMSDQPIINYLVNRSNYKFIDLTHKFNHTRVIKDTKTRFNSYFIHYAGPSGHRYGDRMKQIKLDANVANNSVSFFLSRKFPIYRWVADRLDLDFLKYVLAKFSKK